MSEAPGRIRHAWLTLCVLILPIHAATAHAQSLSHRGFGEGLGFGFPQPTANDRTHMVGDVLVRGEVFFNPAEWVRFTAGAELRANSHNQVEDAWTLRFWDRTDRRPRLAVRTLSTTIARGPFTLDVGKQFIRWGKTDIVIPTDRFSPRDYLTVVDAPFLAVTGVRGTAQLGAYTVEGVWSPRLTPSRIPLLTQRWAGRAGDVAATVPFVQTPTVFPTGAQTGLRIGHVADRLEYSASFYDGFNTLPDFRLRNPDTATEPFQLERLYPAIRSYGADVAIPFPFVTVKGEAAFLTSSSSTTDEYVLYVLQLERMRGEWTFVGGYAGEAVTKERSRLSFSPDRGLSRSLVWRATYTFDTNRHVDLEGAVRQTGDGVYAKAEYSQARGAHWRATVGAVLLAGDDDDFIGQYQHNSHVRLTIRYSY